MALSPNSDGTFSADLQASVDAHGAEACEPLEVFDLGLKLARVGKEVHILVNRDGGRKPLVVRTSLKLFLNAAQAFANAAQAEQAQATPNAG